MASRGSLGSLANQLVRTMLRSPLHFLVSSRWLLITLSGKKDRQAVHHRGDLLAAG